MTHIMKMQENEMTRIADIISRPSYYLKPDLVWDGNYKCWMAIHGNCSGAGKTPAEACMDFDRQFYTGK